MGSLRRTIVCGEDAVGIETGSGCEGEEVQRL